MFKFTAEELRDQQCQMFHTPTTKEEFEKNPIINSGVDCMTAAFMGFNYAMEALAKIAEKQEGSDDTDKESTDAS